MALSALAATWSILVLLFQLNRHISISPPQIPLIFFDLVLFYGPLWILFFSLLVLTGGFFAGKKLPVGLFSQSTLLYFLTLTSILSTLVIFFNYLYYQDFLAMAIRSYFRRQLAVNCLVIVLGVLFWALKHTIRHWLQAIFYGIFLLTIAHGYYSMITPATLANETPPSQLSTESPRHLKILILRGLSLNYILSLPAEQKLRNFEWIRNNGVVGRIRTFSPNYEQALLNAILTGLPPSANPSFTHTRFQFRSLPIEFEIVPRYIFFRNSAKIGLTTFYRKHQLDPEDQLISRYQAIKKTTYSMLSPPPHISYSEKNIRRNDEFLQFFPDIPIETDPKMTILKRAFFLDDYLINAMPAWPDSQYSYFILSLPGLETVTAHFYHYTDPQNFPNLKEELVQKYRSILYRYYQFYDALVGKMIGTMLDDELLAIIGLSEIELLPLWRRIILNYMSGKDIFVYRPNSSPGLFFLFEKNALRRGVFLRSIPIFDIFPTLCYYTGFQLNRNLSGDVIRDIFSDLFLINNPLVTYSDPP